MTKMKRNQRFKLAGLSGVIDNLYNHSVAVKFDGFSAINSFKQSEFLDKAVLEPEPLKLGDFVYFYQSRPIKQHEVIAIDGVEMWIRNVDTQGHNTVSMKHYRKFEEE